MDKALEVKHNQGFLGAPGHPQELINAKNGYELFMETLKEHYGNTTEILREMPETPKSF